MAWSDYPESASDEARRALKHREDNGSSCGTPVGWARAQQLAGREALSDETVKRTFSFLSRAKVYDQGRFEDEDGNEICGSIMYAAWGGDPMLRWAEDTVQKIEERSMKPNGNIQGKAGNKRALDVWELAEVIYLSFREEFYWTASYEAEAEPVEIFPDGTMIAKDRKSRLFFRLNWTIDETTNAVSFTPREQWQPVKREYTTRQMPAHAGAKKQVRHIAAVQEDETSWTITFLKPDMEDQATRAQPQDLRVGDYVSWNSNSGTAYGRVEEVSSEGPLVADSGFEVTGTPDDPAALISIYDYDNSTERWKQREPRLLVVHRFSTLSKEDPAKFASLSRRSLATNPTNMSIERRTVGQKPAIQYRMFGEKQMPVITGYAAVYDSESDDLGGFREIIDRGAFRNTDFSDVRALLNHDANYVLGRTTSGTLKLELDEVGLRYEITPPDTALIRDMVLTPIQRGDISQSSFGFYFGERGYKYEQRADGGEVRRVTDIASVFDVSPVTFPAYTQTEATARSLEQYRSARKGPDDVEGDEDDIPMKKTSSLALASAKVRLLELEDK